MSDDPIMVTGSAPPAEPLGAGASQSPYKNLFVPLVIVPAMIVIVLVLVALFFGWIQGREASLVENLDRVVTGGAGERTQAAFSMVVQLAENQEAKNSGKPLPWPLDASFLPKLRDAWAK